MAFLKHWRLMLIILLLVWSVFLVHPFSKEGVVIDQVRDPASHIFRVGDIITKVNNDKINNIIEFQEAISDIESNETIKISALRETFPYEYREVNYLYLTKEDRHGKTDVALSVKPNPFSKLDLSNEIAGGNKFTIKTSNPDNAIDILSKRFSIMQVSDYSFSKEGDNLILRTTYGDELIPIIENKGELVAKVGDEVYFTNKDIESYCLSGVDCLINLHQSLEKGDNTTSVVWKFGFETKIKEAAANRFSDITEGLSVSVCELDSCVLNDTINYYLDGETIGSEKIFSETKGKPYSTPFIGGNTLTKEEARYSLRFTQAALEGELDAEVLSIEETGPTFGESAIWIIFGSIISIAAIGAIIVAISFKSAKIFLVSAGTNLAEIFIIMGAFAGLNFVVTPTVLATLILIAAFTVAYQIYITVKIKKESFILKKLFEINKKVNWVVIAGFVISGVLVFYVSGIGSPLLLYFTIMFVISKPMFLNSIKERR